MSGEGSPHVSVDGTGLNVTIVSGLWHDQISNGMIAGADGHDWPFHCVEILDGSRSIEVGAAVEFERLAKLGRLEASRIRPAASV